MIYLGKLLQNDDLTIFFSVNDVVADVDKDELNDNSDLLNDIDFTLNTWQTLTEQGLVAFDPYFVAYTIYDCTHGKEEIIRQTTNSKPMRADVGHYWAPFKVDPKLFRVGRHIIKWEYKRYFDSELEASASMFDITRPAAYSGEFCNTSYSTVKQFRSAEIERKC